MKDNYKRKYKKKYMLEPKLPLKKGFKPLIKHWDELIEELTEWLSVHPKEDKGTVGALYLQYEVIRKLIKKDYE